MRLAIEIFVEAILSVLTQWRAALRIAWVPILVMLAFDAFETYKTWNDPEASVSFWLSMLVWIAMVGFLAVGWHRFVVLGEAPGRFWPGTPVSLWLPYGFQWMVLGIVVGILAFLVSYVSFGVMWAFVATDMQLEMSEDFFGSGDIGLTHYVAWGLGGWCFAWVFYRNAMGLVRTALKIGRRSMFASWRQTRPVAGAVFWLGGLSCLGSVPTIFAWPLMDALFDRTQLSLTAEMMIDAGIGLFDFITLIFGAAILNTLYVRTASQAERNPN